MEGLNQPGGWHGQLDRYYNMLLMTTHYMNYLVSYEVTDTVSSCEEQTSPNNSTTVLDVASDNLPIEMKEATNNVSI